VEYELENHSQNFFMIVGPETLHDCIMNIGVLIYCLVQREVQHVHVYFFLILSYCLETD